MLDSIKIATKNQELTFSTADHCRLHSVDYDCETVCRLLQVIGSLASDLSSAVVDTLVGKRGLRSMALSSDERFGAKLRVT